MSQDQAPGWVVPVMRVGYTARGVVYVIVGILALLAAWSGGNAEGTQGALAELKSQPWGTPLLFVIALGLFAYAVWRLMDAWLDLEAYGHDAKGVVARTGQTVSGLVYGGLGVTAIRMALGNTGGSGGEGGTETMASKVLSMQGGGYILMAAGVVIVCAGAYYGYKAVAEKYKSEILSTSTTERLDPAIKAGLIAHGIVIALIGVFVFYAGQSTDPGQAGGLGQAFATVRAQPFGRIMLGVLALGMLGFAVYCFVNAVYRVVPRASGDDVMTLAARAKAEAQGQMRRAATQVH